MNRSEALAEAVIGERVRAVDMPEGVYIDYHFNGWRINFPGGSSSGYGFKEHDETVAWEVYIPPKPQGWDMSKVIAPVIVPPLRSQPKRRGRKAWVPPAEINDIDDIVKATPVETGKPLADIMDGLKPHNPWLEAGLTSEEKPATCWPALDKGTSQ